MHFPNLITTLALTASITTVAAAPHDLTTRQSRPQKPPPCIRQPATTLNQTQTRSEAFAKAFIYDKNITEAFKYIVSDYINHNPAAQNGSDSAWNILSPIWGSQNITPLRTKFGSVDGKPTSWLNYRSGSFGEIVDRFRWEGGCIAEHWDQGEKFPA